MAAEHIVPCNLELGGKSPTIILADADVEAAAAVVRNSGQSCFATTRLLVHRSCHDQLVERITERIRSLRVGRGLDNPDLGPLISAAQQQKVRSYPELAVTEGAEVVQPGDATVLSGGHFEMPALLVGVDNRMRVAQEEIFGPVQSVIVFDEEDDGEALNRTVPQ
jgi:aldehyde dehydrogenase (NAD+)